MKRIPWIHKNCVEELDKILKKEMTVLEFGAGKSTLYFSDKCKSVVSFETDEKWYSRVINEAGENVKIFLYQNLDELTSLLPKEKFNVILIDNAWKIVNRDILIDMSIGLLEKPRVLILDNFKTKGAFPNNWKLSKGNFIKKYSLGKIKSKDFEAKLGPGKTRLFYD